MAQERNADNTVYVGNVDAQCDELLLTELFLQVAPVKTVNIPKDRVQREHQGYAFVEFYSSRDADYAEAVMNGVALYGKNLRIKKSTKKDDSDDFGVGAVLFVKNLDEMVDETIIQQVFGKFGKFYKKPELVTASDGKHARIYYTKFDDSDRAIERMQGQFLLNRVVSVDYAYKKSKKKGAKVEKHGSETERMLAAEAAKHR